MVLELALVGKMLLDAKRMKYPRLIPSPLVNVTFLFVSFATVYEFLSRRSYSIESLNEQNFLY